MIGTPRARAILYAPIVTLRGRDALDFALGRLLDPLAPVRAPPRRMDVQAARDAVLTSVQHVPAPALLLDLQAAMEFGFRQAERGVRFPAASEAFLEIVRNRT